MKATTYANLKDLRERLLGYRFDSVSRLASIPAERLRAIEDEHASPTVFEIEQLAKLYGVGAETLCDEPIRVDPADGIHALACLDEFEHVADSVRARIVAAANAARDLRTLARLDSEALVARLPELGKPDPRRLPFQQGADLAAKLRRRLGLAKGAAVPSVRDIVTESFPSVALLYADLTSDGPAGLTFADPSRGPTIVLNLKGKNLNPAVRRFSLAHELCHLLIDQPRGRPLAVLSGYLTEVALDTEQRANAFAVRFLCPETVLRRLERMKSNALESRLHTLLSKYGLHYAAARLYLRNLLGDQLPEQPPAGLAMVGTETWIEYAEAPRGIESFPLSDVPPERRTRVAELAARAYSQGKLVRDAFAEYLGVTPVHDLDQVLDFFGMPTPSDESLAA